MKLAIAIIVSVGMWFVADLIYDNPANHIGNAIWWRDIFVMSIGIVIITLMN